MHSLLLKNEYTLKYKYKSYHTILDGPVNISSLGEWVDYTIVNYSTFSTYEVYSPDTSVEITVINDTIRIKLTAVRDSIVVIINTDGVYDIYTLPVLLLPSTPSITYPTTGLTINSFTFTATSSPFSSPSGSLHVSSDWQVATNSAFSNIVFQSLNNTTNKTSIQITVSSENTYYIRVRYKDSYNKYSQWSNASSFIISILPPGTPSITYPTTGLTINDFTFTATSSPFSSPSGSLHVSSDWQVATDSAFSNIVFQSLNDTTNKTSIQITVPSENTYYIRVRYKDSNNKYSQWSSVVSFNVNVIPNSEFQILTASDKAADDRFGYSVSLSGNVAIVGAFYASPGGTERAGKAYIFRYNGTSWIQEAILIASDKAANDFFGFSVSISGNVAIVGASRADPGGTTDAGKAYIFRYNGTSWIQEAILIASDKAASDWFGNSVSISGNVAIVGADRANPGGTTRAGKAYIFRYNGTSWIQEAILIASDKTADDRFGNSVSISGNVAIVGAYKADPSGTEDAGKAYIFRYNGTSWIQEAILIASDKAASDWFGNSVSISGNIAIVGANLADPGGITNAGKAYIFRYNGTSWIQEAILTASDKAATDHFGFSVSISGNVTIVGAYYASPGGITKAGKAYIFRYNGTSWIQEAILIASDKAASDWFGYSVSISGNVAIVGAYLASPGGITKAGKAYIFV